MKKTTALLAITLILAMLVSAVIPMAADNSFGEPIEDYDDYGYYAYFDFENYGNSTHHLAYMRGETITNADGLACDPFGFLLNEHGNVRGTRELKTEENGNKYYSFVQSQAADGDYCAMAVFSLQSSLTSKNYNITEAVEVSFRFRMHETQPEKATGKMRLINIRRGEKASLTDHILADTDGNIYALIGGNKVKVYENTDKSQFLDISFRWYDATNTYSLYINGDPVVEAMTMGKNYRDVEYVTMTFDDDFNVEERNLVATQQGHIRAIELCRGDDKNYGFDIDDIKLSRIETAQGGRVYYENTFSTQHDGLMQRVAINEGNNAYAFTQSSGISLNNKELNISSGSNFALSDNTYQLFSQDSFVIEATVKADVTHTSGHKALFKYSDDVNTVGMLYVDKNGNLYIEKDKEYTLIGGYKLSKDTALDITVVAIKSVTNGGKFGMFTSSSGKTTSSKNCFFMLSYFINGEYVGSSKDQTMYEWKIKSTSAGTGRTASNRDMTVTYTEVTGTENAPLDTSNLVEVASGSYTDANHVIYKTADGLAYYDVEYSSDGKTQLRYATMTIASTKSGAETLKFFADATFDGTIDNIRVYEGTAPEWYYESINSATGGKILDVDFAKLAASANSAKAQTTDKKDPNALGIFSTGGFINTSLVRKTSDGTEVTASNATQSYYSTVTINNDNYVDFFIPVPETKNGIREAEYIFETTIKNINITAGTQEHSGQLHLFKQRIEYDATKDASISGDLFSVDANLKLYGGNYGSAGNDNRFALCNANGEQIVLDNDNWNTLSASVYCYDDGGEGKYLVSYYFNGELTYLEDGSAAYYIANSNYTYTLKSYWGEPHHRVRYVSAIGGDKVTFDVKSVKISAGNVETAQYEEVSEKPFDIDSRVSVIELDIPNYTNDAKEGHYAILNLKKTEKDFGVIYADVKSGELAVLYNGIYETLYTENGDPIVLGDEPVSLTVVYDDILYRSRYYVNGALAYIESGDSYKALADICIADSNFVYDSRDTSFALFSGYGENLDISRYNFNVYGVNDGDTAEVIGYQESTLENGIRIVAGLDTLYYNRVGFEVERLENGVSVGSKEIKSNVVYSSISAGENEISAEEEGYKYLATLSIEDLPEDIPENTLLVIRAFTEVNGVKRYDFKAEIAVSNDGYKFVESDDTKVYTQKQAVLLVGQSNMAGRGWLKTVAPISDSRIKLLRNNQWIQMVEPIHTDKNSAGVGLAASFAKAFVETFDVELGLIPAAVGGTSIAQWTKGFSGESDLDLFENAVAMGKKAQEDGYEICAILWHQGCSNENTSKYDEKVRKVFDDFISELNLDPDKIVIVTGELGEFRPTGSANVNSTIAKIAPYYKNYGVATSENLLAVDVTTHFDGPSLRVFGYRYFEQFYKLVTGKKYEFVDDVEYYRVDPSDVVQPDDGDDGDDGDYVAKVNFNSLTAGTTYASNTDVDKIQFRPGGKSVQVVAKESDTNDKYLAMNFENGKTVPYVDIVNEYVAGSIVVTEVKFMMNDGFNVAGPLLKLVQTNPNVASIHLLRVGTDGKLYNSTTDNKQGSALVNPANGMTYTLDKFEWTTVKVVADLANNTKDIYIDGTLCGEGLTLAASASTAASFNVALTRIGQLEASGTTAILYVDDFKSYNGEKAEETVTSCNFDSFTAGNITAENRDMGIAYFSIGSTAPMAIVADGTNKYVSTSSATTANNNGYFDIINSSAAGNDITIEAKFKLGKYNENDCAASGDLLKLLDPSNVTIALVHLAQDGTLKDFVYSGTGTYPSVGNSLGVKLSESEWTTVKVVCHMNDNKKDVYVNGTLVLEGGVLYNTNGAANYVTAKTRIMHYKSSGIGTVFVDDYSFTR